MRGEEPLFRYAPQGFLPPQKQVQPQQRKPKARQSPDRAVQMRLKSSAQLNRRASCLHFGVHFTVSAVNFC